MPWCILLLIALFVACIHLTRVKNRWNPFELFQTGSSHVAAAAAPALWQHCTPFLVQLSGVLLQQTIQ